MEQLLTILLAFLVGGITGGYIVWRRIGPKKHIFKGPRGYDQSEQIAKLLIQSEDRREGWYMRLPEDQLKRVRQMAGGVLRGRDLTGAAWAGHGKLFSRAEFESIRQLMMERGWLEWKNPHAPNMGMILTNPGWAAFRYLAGVKAPSPTQIDLHLSNPVPAAYTHKCTQKARNPFPQ